MEPEALPITQEPEFVAAPPVSVVVASRPTAHEIDMDFMALVQMMDGQWT